jgi:3D (Asp-Asp-Asp) domain-containing protein
VKPAPTIHALALAGALALSLGTLGCATPWTVLSHRHERPPPSAEREPAPESVRQLRVTATAYNSLPGQGHGDPTLAAWGDRLRPGMRAIAVSRDLLEQGLGYETRVRIEGLPGEYVVRDKMARRWKRRIDIYMGEDVEAARSWGVRDVHISWSPAPEKDALGASSGE